MRRCMFCLWRIWPWQRRYSRVDGEGIRDWWHAHCWDEP